MKLIGITDDRHSTNELVQKLLDTALYIDFVILREKTKTDEELALLVKQLTSTGFPAQKLIMHARPALAETLGIKRVQLTGYGMSLAEARETYPQMHFGKSVHSLQEAEEAEVQGASWLLYGHIFATASKPGIEPRGTDELFDIAVTCRVPVYAIGGIEPGHLPFLEEHGVSGAAILSPLSRGCEAVKKYRSREDARFIGTND